MRGLGLPGVVLASTLAACRPVQPPPSHERGLEAPPRTAPAAEVIPFDGPGVKLSYPAGAWVGTPSDEFVLRLVATDGSRQSLSLDVPKLPPHIPGLIPLGMVVNGYIDDLKKKYPGVKVEERIPMKVAGANARRVWSAWEQGDGQYVEQAVLTVHGDRVYIFRTNSPAVEETKAVAALDQILASVSWD